VKTNLTVLFISSAVLMCMAGCGGGGSSSCTSNLECSETEFCNFLDGACGAAGSGECAEVPDVCTEVMAPVCSCDSLTFFNECWSFAAGQSVRSPGECPN